MTRAELLALAKRVEKADLTDWQSCFALRREIASKCCDYDMADDEVPEFLSSIDAAASLMPEGWDLEISSAAVDSNVVRCAVYVTRRSTGWRRRCMAYASSEPKARTAAALRARAEEAGDA